MIIFSFSPFEVLPPPPPHLPRVSPVTQKPKLSPLTPDFGEGEGGQGGKQVFACHNFLDYSGEARRAVVVNIEETMAILTR